MWGPRARYMSAVERERASDEWIRRNIPGGLNSPLGQALDEYFGGNPNPTAGQQIIGTGMGLAHSGGYGGGHHHHHRHRAYPRTIGYPPGALKFYPWKRW